jgi:hypothetical protein
MHSDTAIPTYLRERVRRPLPPGSMVMPGSTPVVAFGNARRATVATLGLNPSRVEFLDRHGHEFTEAQRRLETCRSLSVGSLPMHQMLPWIASSSAVMATSSATRTVAGSTRWNRCYRVLARTPTDRPVTIS